MVTIEHLRKKIEKIDAVIMEQLAERQALSKQIGQIKIDEGRDIIDLSREQKIFEFYEKLADEYKLQHTFVKQLFEIIIAHSRQVQAS